jgi:hypothetical protein
MAKSSWQRVKQPSNHLVMYSDITLNSQCGAFCAPPLTTVNSSASLPRNAKLMFDLSKNKGRVGCHQPSQISLPTLFVNAVRSVDQLRRFLSC